MEKKKKTNKNEPTKSNQAKIIKKYERRWVKPTVIALVLILVPIALFFSVNGVVIHKAMTDYNATIGDVSTLLQRDDPNTFFKETPNETKDPIAKNNELLPSGPVLISFYLRHCKYCEAAHSTVEKEIKAFTEEHPDQAERIVYVDVRSPFGKELVSKYKVQGAASILLLDGEFNSLTYMASDTPNGIVVEKDAIHNSFTQLATRISDK